MTTKQSAMERAREEATGLSYYIRENWYKRDFALEQFEKKMTNALLAVRKEVLEKAAKAVCLGCRYDLPIAKIDDFDIHVFKDGSKRACQAQDIRKLEE